MLNFLENPKNVNLFHMFVVAVVLYLLTTDYFPFNKNNFLRYLALGVFLYHGWLYYNRVQTEKHAEGYFNLGDYDPESHYGTSRGIHIIRKMITQDVVGNGRVHYIRMFDSDPGYSTPKLVIKAGDVVIWTNVGEIEHTVTSAKLDRYPQGIMEPSGEFNSGYMKPGMSFAIKFTQKGEFPYFCIPHKGWMQGVIIVN